MARALVLWWCVGAAVAASYDEYAAHMPSYDEPGARAPVPDDYRAHSPDYKYEEDLQAKTEQSPNVEAAEIDSRARAGRRYRAKHDADFGIDGTDRSDPNEEYPKMSNRFTSRRPRLKSRKSDRGNDYGPRKTRVTKNERYDNELDRDEYTDRGDFAEKRGSRLESDIRDRLSRRSSEKVVRRKPRDGYMRSAKRKSEEEETDDIEKAEDSVDRDLHAWKMEREMERDARRRPAPLSFPSDDDIFRTSPRVPPRHNYNEYDGEFYDMKRVKTAQNFAQASSMRRTQARLMVPGRPLVPAPPLKTLDALIANRRLLPELPASAPAPSVDLIPSLFVTTLETTLETTTESTTLTTTSSAKSTASKELSLAEKSRLSILKKIQRKEGVRNETRTRKPAVLLQVTAHVPTVVVVEPATSAHPWMRARTVTEDSPGRLQHVKRLMRHKLLANARSMNDLTDNWDDVVCDYIDLSLLDSGGAPAGTPARHLLILSVLVSTPILSH